MKTDPREVLNDTIIYSLCLDKRGKYEKPGSVIQALSEEKREVLKSLTSEESVSMRNLLL